jgi:TorA maturation chaperone TorD
MSAADERHQAGEANRTDEVFPDSAQGRSTAYSVLATLLSGPPTEAMLHELASLAGFGTTSDTGPLDEAWVRLGSAALAVDPQAVADEYHALFIGLTQGELIPYASWYRRGALMDRPLVRVRRDLAGLGLAREAGVREPEDHAATLCAAMQELLAEHEDAAAGKFYLEHVGPWLGALFADMERARSADFYRAVADFGNSLTAVESIYWSLPDEGPDEV